MTVKHAQVKVFDMSFHMGISLLAYSIWNIEHLYSPHFIFARRQNDISLNVSTPFLFRWQHAIRTAVVQIWRNPSENVWLR